MPNKKTDLEDRLQAAIATKNEDPDLSIRDLAKRLGLSNTTLKNRLKNGTAPRNIANASQQLLSYLGEKRIVKRIENYDNRSIPLHHGHVIQMVYEILKGKGRVAKIGNAWVDRFVQRHPGI